MQNTIDGITYESRPDHDNGCKGCAAENGPPGGLCARLRQTRGEDSYCEDNGVIWVEKVSPAAPQEITTSHGKLQRAAVEGQDVCEGCVALYNRELCREINFKTAPCYENRNIIWIKSQPAAPDYSEVLCILQEEAAEVITAVSKVRRFGLEASHPDRTTTNKQELEEEVGDLLAMIEILTSTNYLDPKAVQDYKQAKTQKLQQLWTTNSIG